MRFSVLNKLLINTGKGLDTVMRLMIHDMRPIIHTLTHMRLYPYTGKGLGDNRRLRGGFELLVGGLEGSMPLAVLLLVA